MKIAVIADVQSKMKHPSIRGIQPPHMPKLLTPQEITALADHAEYAMSRLMKCDFTGQTATEILFEQVELKRTAFLGTILTDVRLFDVRAVTCDLSAADWRKARLRRVEFIECRLLGIQWVETQLEDVAFKGCNLENAVLASAVCKRARFDGCVLRGAMFDGADLRGVIFRDCDLTGADLQGANLREADLRGSLIDGLRIGPREVQGAIIDPTQAVQVAALLGLTVKPLDADILSGTERR